MALHITLTRYDTPLTTDPITNQGVNYIKIVAEPVDASVDDPAIFVYQVEPLLPDASSVAYSFTNVCSLKDLSVLPAYPPGSGDDFVLFRADTIEHYSQSLAESDALWSAVLADVTRLVNASKRVDALGGDPTTTVTF